MTWTEVEVPAPPPSVVQMVCMDVKQQWTDQSRTSCVKVEVDIYHWLELAATIIIFVMTNVCLLSRQVCDIFVMTKLLSQQIFVMTNIILLWQNFCHDKYMFVAAKRVFCHHKSLYKQCVCSSKTCCHEKSMLVVTKKNNVATTKMSQQTHVWSWQIFVTTNILSWQKYFVTTSII